MLILIALAVICVLGLVLYLNLDRKTQYKNLNERHVVITGGSSGIGKSSAMEAAKLGANVTIIGRDEEKLKSAVIEITAQCLDKENQNIQYTVLDVTSDYQTIQRTLKSIEDKTGPIFMLVNCAGMCICGQFENMDDKDIKKMIDLNYFGTAYPTRYVLPGMKSRNEGIIVFVASEAAFIGIYGYSAYSAAKWALRGLAEAMFMELVGTNVRLMLSFPPDTDTPGFEREELTKPDETKLISSSGGLHTPDEVGKKLVHDAMDGRLYSVYSWSGELMSLLYCGSIDSVTQVFLQIISMGALRAVVVGTLLSFHKIVRDGLNTKKTESSKTK